MNTLSKIVLVLFFVNMWTFLVAPIKTIGKYMNPEMQWTFTCGVFAVIGLNHGQVLSG